MIRVIDGNLETELTTDEMHILYSAVEDYVEEYPEAKTAKTLLLKLQRVYHRPGSDS